MILENAIEEIKNETGLDQDKVGTILQDWATPLMRKGIIVRLSIKRWRAVQNINNGDFGINSNDPEWEQFSNKYLKYGIKYLLPKETLQELSRVENKARRNLKEHSMETPWGDFVPFNSYFEWKEKNEEICKEYFELADRLTNEFPYLIQQVLDEYKKHARHIYNEKKLSISYEDFERQMLDDIMQSIIPANEFRATFVYNTLFFFIPIPSDVQKELLEFEKASLEKEKTENELAEVRKERDIRKKIIEETAKLKDLTKTPLTSWIQDANKRGLNGEQLVKDYQDIKKEAEKK
jgi:hypothetical protein